jgi:uroporphyrinogen III methyltransferase / synthase
MKKNMSLHDRTILIACSAKKTAELTEGLESMGGMVIPFPVIEIKPIEDTGPLDRAIASIQQYTWIIFTSVHGVEFFMQRLLERGTASGCRLPGICAIGPATAKAVAGFGYEAALIPDRFVAEGIVEALQNKSGGLRSLAGQRILLARAKEGRDLIPEALKSSDIQVDVVPCYQTVRSEFAENAIQRLRNLKPDLIVFTSSSTVRNFVDILGQEDGNRMLREAVVAVLGPVTARTVENFEKRAEIMPKEHTIASLLEEISGFYSRNNSC